MKNTVLFKFKEFPIRVIMLKLDRRNVKLFKKWNDFVKYDFFDQCKKDLNSTDLTLKNQQMKFLNLRNKNYKDLRIKKIEISNEILKKMFI